MKTCALCGEEKPLDRFSLDSARSDGRCRLCVPCNRSYQSEQYAKRRAKDPKVSWSKYVTAAARTRAKKRGLPFNLTAAFVLSLAPSVCPALGIPISYENQGYHADNSPSLDRRDNSCGYTTDNVVVLSWRANSLKKDSTPEELIRLAQFVQQLQR